MSLFQCEECGCRENTAVCNYWIRNDKESSCGGRKLCSLCDPDIKKWHNKFRRLMLPVGEFKTNEVGNLEHIETGRTDIFNFEIQRR